MIKALGGEVIFGVEADFSGILSNGDVYVSNMIHEASVDVNETGTEASAASAVVLNKKRRRYETPIEFVCDRPFMFIIHDSCKCAIFVGKYMNPKN